MRKILVLTIVGFVVFCGFLVVKSELFEKNCKRKPGCILLQQSVEENRTDVTAAKSDDKGYQLRASKFVGFGADDAPAKNVTIGSTDPKSGFKFELVLTSQAAAIKEAVLSEFDDRNYENPQPMKLLSPVKAGGGRKILSLANKNFVFTEWQLQLPLDKLHWQSLGVNKDDDGQTAGFEAVIKDNATGKPVVKLTKNYKISFDSYRVDCRLSIENLSTEEQKVRFDMTGPLGIDREGIRADMRNVVAGFRNIEDKITSSRLDTKKLRKAMTVKDRRLEHESDTFLWIAAVNKYFAAILRPLPAGEKKYCDWVSDKTGTFYNPDGDTKADSGDETIGVDLKIATNTLRPAGQNDSTRTYNFELYLLPKDKRIFDKTELFRELGFFNTITFMACCCPSSVIYPLAFGILALMEWMHNFIPNYGVVIIILVFVIRIVIHPLTKKSQVSMSKMTKLAPMAEEIKKKYASNKAEMQKQLMALYKKQGASPVMGMLPMIVQMPIWISLYSAIYASIALRGAAFLPVWITDLSSPDALFRFSTVTIPLLGWKVDSFNLLPIMMGVAFYFQQKMMPKQASAATNPQVAQQQKMMMVMMPIMFPLLLYKAPSGLNLYIMASTFAGVIEQYIIRKHIREKEQIEAIGLVSVTSKTGGKVKKKKPKPFYKNR